MRSDHDRLLGMLQIFVFAPPRLRQKASYHLRQSLQRQPRYLGDVHPCEFDRQRGPVKPLAVT